MSDLNVGKYAGNSITKIMANIAVSDVVRMLGKADAKARYGGQFGLPVIHAKAPATVPKEGLQELTKVPVSVD